MDETQRIISLKEFIRKLKGTDNIIYSLKKEYTIERKGLTERDETLYELRRANI